MNKLLKFGILSLTLILLAVFGFFYLKLKKTPTSDNLESGARLEVNGESKKISWIKFDYSETPGIGFTMKAPNDLALDKEGETGDYADFIRFQEISSSKSSGINVGVRENTLEAEVRKIKSELESQGVLVDEKPIVFNGFPAKRLYFRPKNQEGFEERVIVVTTKDKYSVSISTSPSQIDQVLENFKYTN